MMKMTIEPKWDSNSSGSDRQEIEIRPAATTGFVWLELKDPDRSVEVSIKLLRLALEMAEKSQ